MRHFIPLLLLITSVVVLSAEDKPSPERVIREVAGIPTATEPIRLAPDLFLSMTWDSRQQSATYCLTELTDRKPIFTFGENSVKQSEPYLLRWDAPKKVLWFVTRDTITKVSLSKGLRKSTTFARKNALALSLPDMPADLANANADLLHSTAATTPPTP
jgi:hypothetical protein